CNEICFNQRPQHTLQLLWVEVIFFHQKGISHPSVDVSCQLLCIYLPHRTTNPLIPQNLTGFSGLHRPALFSAAFNTGEYFHVITFRASNTMGFPVLGFLPVRACFDLTFHFPKPEIITSSPAASRFFTISSNFSTTSIASPFMKPQSSAIFFAMSALVNVMTTSPN